MEKEDWRDLFVHLNSAGGEACISGAGGKGWAFDRRAEKSIQHEASIAGILKGTGPHNS